MSTPEIPFLDLVTVHRELRDELRSVFETALDTAGFIGGPVVREFERDFAEFCEAPFCVGMASGTDALRFALIAAGVRAGDTVVTVPLTFIATTEAISQAGARTDFVDIDERTYTMDPEKLRSYLEIECVRVPQTNRVVSQRTGSPVTAVIPVHLYGQTADMDPILDLATQYNLIVIEDEGLARRCRMLRDHGQAQKYSHEFEGSNGRLDAIQAGILRLKLKHLDTWN